MYMIIQVFTQEFTQMAVCILLLTRAENMPGVSHIDFCYHYQLIVTKTANTTYKRTYDWEIQKNCNGPDPLTLSAGQVYNYPFSWTATHSHTDSDWKVTGIITIANNSPFSATVTSLSDVLSGGQTASITCSLPVTVPAGSTVNCGYSVSVAAPYNGINTATAGTSNPMVEGGSGTAVFAFGQPTNLVDECITISDDCTSMQTLCSSNAPSTVNYSCPVGPYASCSDNLYTNNADFTTNDTGATGSSSCTVSVNVPCGGCTLTQGYWKTHSSYGPAPYDDNWANVGENTMFYLSGKTWYQVLWTPPAGNAYYILAHQYIAAKLNILNGASSTDAVDAAINCAEMHFGIYTPAYISGLTNKSKIRLKMLSMATTLDNYNNGIIGPGHCDEPLAYRPVIEGPQEVIGVDLTLGTRVKNEVDRMTITPNPADAQVDLGFDGYKGEGWWNIIDITGRTIMQIYRATQAQHTTVDLSHLNTGIYIVRLTSNDGAVITTSKFIIVR